MGLFGLRGGENHFFFDKGVFKKGVIYLGEYLGLCKRGLMRGDSSLLFIFYFEVGLAEPTNIKKKSIRGVCFDIYEFNGGCYEYSCGCRYDVTCDYDEYSLLLIVPLRLSLLLVLPLLRVVLRQGLH